MVDHDLEVLLRRQIDQFFALRGSAGEGLLNKHVLAVFEGSLGEFVMRPHRRYNGNRIDLRRRDHFRRARNDLHAGVSLLRAHAGLWADLRNCQDLGILRDS